MAISVSTPNSAEDVMNSYAKHVQSILAKLVVNPATVPHHTLQSGLLRYKKRIWVGVICSCIRELSRPYMTVLWGVTVAYL